MRRFLLAGLALILAFAGANVGFAQGVQTAILTGSVTSNDGQPLPGVTVTVTSPALIGERSTFTGVNGDFVIRGLPPGQYTVTFTLEGMQSVERSATLPLGGTARSDATMEVAAAEETIVVTGEAPSALETTSVGANFTAEDIDALPVARNPQAIAELSGGLTDNGTVAGQITIGGAFAYDNIFLVNGVDVNDRFFGTANNLFIEDAIEETQVLTSGVSAEYGRFSGGVINAITKSGGNQFSGSFRADLTRPEWRDETPIEQDQNIEREGDLAKIYSATLGGPIVRDLMWFFLAGRQDESSQNITLPISQFNYTNQIEEPRYEVKLTGNITSNHTLQASYLTYERSQSYERQVNPLEEDALSRDSKRENDGFVISYNGVFGNNLFGELRYSEKHFGFVNLGGTSTRIEDSPLYSYGVLPGNETGIYNAPYFDATDPEDRDNEQWYGALSYFLSTESGGSHDIKGGVEIFSDIGVGGNSQTATGFNPTVDFLTDADANPVFDADGNLIPVWIPYYYTFMYNWVPVRGARQELETTSIFVNDRWNLNSNWSFNIGARYEQVTSTSEVGVPEIKSDSIVPRLGLKWDVQGNGKYLIDANYAEYAGRAAANQFGAASPAGNPALAIGWYVGPEGIGTDFAPAYDLDNYIWFSLSNPIQTTAVDPDLKTPRTREYTLSGGMQLPKGGYLKLIYVNRDVSDFIEDFTDRESEVVPVTVGEFSGFETEVTRYENSDHPSREYEAIQLQGNYNLTDNWTLGGNWTHELKNDGDFEGEAGQSPQIGSTFGDYPDVLPANRYFPTGRLDNFQEDKVRVWSNYVFDFGRGGALDLGALFRYDSALTFSYARAFGLTDIQQELGEGYNSLPSSRNLFFGERGRGEYESIWSLDLALQYSIPVWKTVEPWVKFSITNVTNEDGLVTYNTQIIPDTEGPLDEYGLPTTYDLGPNFGRATAAGNYQIPREYFVSLGIRF